MQILFLALAVALAGPTGGVPGGSAGQDPVLFVRAKRVHVAPGQVLEDAGVLIQDGVILRVEAGLSPPTGATIIEGEVVCAGFLDVWSRLGVVADSLEDSKANATTRAEDAVDTFETQYKRSLAMRSGVVAVHSQAAPRAAIGGLGAVLSTGPGQDRERLVLLGDASVGASIGLSGRSATDVFDRIGQVDKLVDALRSGYEYYLDLVAYNVELAEWEAAIVEQEEELQDDFKKAKKSREKELEKAEEDGKEHKEKRYKEDSRPKRPKYDAADEVLARVANGELPLIVQVHRAAELRELLAGTAGMDRLRLIVAGGTEALSVAPALARRGVPVIVRPIPYGVGRVDEYAQHDLSLAGELAAADVPVLIGTGSPHAEDLPLLAGLAVGHGLDREQAFAALTLDAARALDLAGELGSVRPGRRAELLVLDGEPLSPTTRVRYVLSGGGVTVSPEN